MKIGFKNLNLEEGKIKYLDSFFEKLKYTNYSKKIIPFFVEFTKDISVKLDAIIISKDTILDLLIDDMERIESIILKNDIKNKKILNKCMENLENEIPIYDIDLSPEDKNYIKQLSLISDRPIIKVSDPENININSIIELVLDKLNYMFFYTIGQKESKSWLVHKQSTILECANHIHTDLAIGFIRGEVLTFDECFKNDKFIREAPRIVDRNYIVKPNEILNIRFSVSKKIK